MSYTIIFDYIAVIKNLIDCNSFVDCKSLADYIRLIIQKVTVKVIINFDAKKFAAYISIAKKLAI